MLHYRLSQMLNENIMAEIENKGNTSIAVLKMGSVFTPYSSNCLVIRDKYGEEVPYIGGKSKYIFDPEFSVYRLKAGAKIAIRIPLKQQYSVLNGKTYSVDLRRNTFVKPLINDTRDSPKSIEEFTDASTMGMLMGKPITLSFNSIQRAWPEFSYSESNYVKSVENTPGQCPLFFCVIPARNIGKAWCIAVGNPLPADLISLPVCSESLQGRNKRILQNLTTALSYHHRHKVKVTNDALYKKWFGTYTSSNFDVVRRTAARAKPNRVCKTCFFSSSGYYPNVAPDTVATASYYPGTNSVGITLFPKFWKMPFSGQDSQIGTLVHEYSHGYSNTDDFEYGAQNCLKLARNDPSKAIRNADNYQFYVEELLGNVATPPWVTSPHQ